MSHTSVQISVMRRTLQLALFIAIMLGMPCAKAQELQGYDNTTGNDSTLWVDMTAGANTVYCNQAVVLPFKFYFMGYLYNEVTVTQTGVVCFESPSSPNLAHGYRANFNPYYSLFHLDIGSQNWKWKMLGTPGNRVFVCEGLQRFVGWS